MRAEIRSLSQPNAKPAATVPRHLRQEDGCGLDPAQPLCRQDRELLEHEARAEAGAERRDRCDGPEARRADRVAGGKRGSSPGERYRPQAAVPAVRLLADVGRSVDDREQSDRDDRRPDRDARDDPGGSPADGVDDSREQDRRERHHPGGQRHREPDCEAPSSVEPQRDPCLPGEAQARPGRACGCRTNASASVTMPWTAPVAISAEPERERRSTSIARLMPVRSIQRPIDGNANAPGDRSDEVRSRNGRP